MSQVVEELVTRLTADDQYSAKANQATNATKGLSNALGSSGGGFDGFGSGAKLAFAELDSGTPILGEVVSILKSITIVSGAAVLAMAGFGLYAMHAAGDVEALKLGLTAYAGSAEKATAEMKRLREVARLPGLGFEEAVAGSTALQAVGFDARLAERAIMGFGNALALVGKGKDDLDGVIVALSQIVSKGSVSAEEINQIAERVPQIRQVMKAAFGTADTEEIAKSVGPQEFINKVIDALAKLPVAAGGAKNAFENFGDTAKKVVDQIGDVLNARLLPAFSRLGDFVDFLGDIKEFSGLADGFLDAASHGEQLLAVVDKLDAMAEGVGLQSLSNIFNFLGGSAGFGDGLVRGAAVAVATFERIPDILSLGLDIVLSNMAQIADFVNGVIRAINAVLANLTNGINIEGYIAGQKVDLGHIGLGNFQGIDELPAFGPTTEQKKRANEIGGGVAGRAQELYDGFGHYKPSDEVGSDGSKGGFTEAESWNQKIEKNTRDTAKHTDDLNRAMKDQILGGGAVGKGAGAAVNITKALHGGGSGGDKVDQIARLLREVMAEESMGAILDDGYRRRSGR